MIISSFNIYNTILQLLISCNFIQFIKISKVSRIEKSIFNILNNPQFPSNYSTILLQNLVNKFPIIKYLAGHRRKKKHSLLLSHDDNERMDERCAKTRYYFLPTNDRKRKQAVPNRYNLTVETRKNDFIPPICERAIVV